MTHTIQQKRAGEAGFTLVELSIVLVIIGLIVGGVLAGQDMIRAAEIRATISQIEEYNTATNTFRDKYRAMPGDIAQGGALNFGLENGATPGTDDRLTMLVNQNGLLECTDTGNCADIRSFGNETALFWVDLSTKNLIETSLNTADPTIGGGAGAAITPGGASDLFDYLPEAQLGKGNYITVFSASGRNFYQLTGVTSIDNTDGSYTLVNALSPQDGFNIDAKMDDAQPLTGTVRALNSTAVTSLNNNTATFDPAITTYTRVGAAADVGNCVEDGTLPADGDSDYNTYTEDEANAPACQLRFMFN